MKSLFLDEHHLKNGIREDQVNVIINKAKVTFVFLNLLIKKIVEGVSFCEDLFFI